MLHKSTINDIFSKKEKIKYNICFHQTTPNMFCIDKETAYKLNT